MIDPRGIRIRNFDDLMFETVKVSRTPVEAWANMMLYGTINGYWLTVSWMRMARLWWGLSR